MMTTATAATAPARRSLRFGSLEDLLADIDALDARGHIDASGQWTPAQIVEHVTRFIDGSVNGFDVRAPLVLRVFGKFAKRQVIHRPMKPGFRLPAKMGEAFAPPADVSWDEAVSYFREMIALARQNGMTKESPVFGQLSDAEWEQLHCRHAELHFSFLS